MKCEHKCKWTGFRFSGVRFARGRGGAYYHGVVNCARLADGGGDTLLRHYIYRVKGAEDVVESFERRGGAAAWRCGGGREG